MQDSQDQKDDIQTQFYQKAMSPQQQALHAQLRAERMLTVQTQLKVKRIRKTIQKRQRQLRKKDQQLSEMQQILQEYKQKFIKEGARAEKFLIQKTANQEKILQMTQRMTDLSYKIQHLEREVKESQLLSANLQNYIHNQTVRLYQFQQQIATLNSQLEETQISANLIANERNEVYSRYRALEEHNYKLQDVIQAQTQQYQERERQLNERYTLSLNNARQAYQQLVEDAKRQYKERQMILQSKQQLQNQYQRTQQEYIRQRKIRDEQYQFEKRKLKQQWETEKIRLKERHKAQQNKLRDNNNQIMELFTKDRKQQEQQIQRLQRLSNTTKQALDRANQSINTAQNDVKKIQSQRNNLIKIRKQLQEREKQLIKHNQLLKYEKMSIYNESVQTRTNLLNIQQQLHDQKVKFNQRELEILRKYREEIEQLENKMKQMKQQIKQIKIENKQKDAKIKELNELERKAASIINQFPILLQKQIDKTNKKHEQLRDKYNKAEKQKQANRKKRLTVQRLINAQWRPSQEETTRFRLQNSILQEEVRNLRQSQEKQKILKIEKNKVSSTVQANWYPQNTEQMNIFQFDDMQQQQQAILSGTIAVNSGINYGNSTITLNQHQDGQIWIGIQIKKRNYSFFTKNCIKIPKNALRRIPLVFQQLLDISPNPKTMILISSKVSMIKDDYKGIVYYSLRMVKYYRDEPTPTKNGFNLRQNQMMKLCDIIKTLYQ